MELTPSQTKITKGIAILMMLCLHLFNDLNYGDNFIPLLFIGTKPLVFYISLFCDCCVAIYCFCSGYGLFIGFSKSPDNYHAKNLLRLLKIYVNFWIILLLFAVCLGFALNRESVYPGSWLKFLLNFTAIQTSYNGAWWFLTTYILLVLTSPLIFHLIKKYNQYALLTAAFMVYLAAYIQRVKMPLHFSQALADGVLTQLALYGMSLFPFAIGAIAFKYKWYTKFSKAVDRLRFKHTVPILLILMAVIFHGFIPSLFVAAFTGVLFIFCFNKINLPAATNRMLLFFSDHSTNIWLTHMFFYLIYFHKLVFMMKYPVLIYCWLLLLCLLSSYIINLIYVPVVKWIDKKPDSR